MRSEGHSLDLARALPAYSAPDAIGSSNNVNAQLLHRQLPDEVPPAYDALADPKAALQSAAVRSSPLSPRYLAVSTSQHGALLLRSDGVVDRYSRGCIRRQYSAFGPLTHPRAGRTSRGPSHGPDGSPLRYVGVSSGCHQHYLIRSDGCLIRIPVCSAATTAELRPPPGQRYVGVSSGPHASYFIRSDGKAERYRHAARTIEIVYTPPGWPKVVYTKASAGQRSSWLVRSDGKVDRIQGGQIDDSVAPTAPGVMYIGVSDQLEIQTDKGRACNWATYLVRDDGAADRVTYQLFGGVCLTSMRPPPGSKYVATSSGHHVSYALRDDGVLERIKGGVVDSLVQPECTGAVPATGYVGVSAGPQYSYGLRSDGVAERLWRGKAVDRITALTADEFERKKQERSGCTIV